MKVIRVFEIVPGNWTHSETDHAWGPSSGGKEAATHDAYKCRQSGDRVDVEFSLELQQRAKRLNVNLYAKADRRDVIGLPPKPYDPFELSTGRDK